MKYTYVFFQRTPFTESKQEFMFDISIQNIF